MDTILSKLSVIPELQERFKMKEDECLSISHRPENKYLCFRLDGINVSKRHLKDKLYNKKFEDDLTGAINYVYNGMRKMTDTAAQNIFLCLFVTSDEVSIVFNQCNNYYKDRIYKIGSTLAGSLSAAMTGIYNAKVNKAKKRKDKKSNWKNNKYHVEKIAFDSRPILLDSIEDVKDYIRYRRFLFARNNMAKVLRIKTNIGDDIIYADENKNNIEWMVDNIKDNDLIDKYKNSLKNSRMFVPTKEGNLNEYRLTADFNELQRCFLEIQSYEIWIQKANLGNLHK